MRTVTVDVTQEDIDGGEGGDCFDCPVALAIHRAIGECASVGHGRAYGFGWSAHLPSEVGDFIVAFDAGRAVRPIAFPLHVPNAPEVSHA